MINVFSKKLVWYGLIDFMMQLWMQFPIVNNDELLRGLGFIKIW